MSIWLICHFKHLLSEHSRAFANFSLNYTMDSDSASSLSILQEKYMIVLLSPLRRAADLKYGNTSDGDISSAECLLCLKVFAYNGGTTSNLMSH